MVAGTLCQGSKLRALGHRPFERLGGRAVFALQVSALVHPDLLVEIEADALEP